MSTFAGFDVSQAKPYVSVVFSSVAQGENLVRAMIKGKKRAPESMKA